MESTKFKHNIIIDGVHKKVKSDKEINLMDKVQLEGKNYRVYRMRTENFKMYFHLRELK